MRWWIGMIILLAGSAAMAGGLPWMGVSLKTDRETAEREGPLPEGVGFEVSRLVSGGPAARAGVEEGDLWWKIDGQILVNKSQMVVLLRNKKVGDTVELDFYREGALARLPLTLGTRGHQRLIPVSLREENEEEARILARREKVARVKLAGKDLSLETEGDRWRFKVREDGVTVLSALVGDDEMDERIPVQWHHAYVILRMTLGDGGEKMEVPQRRRARFLPRAKSPTK